MKNKNITIIEEHLNKYKNVHELENYFQEELDFPPSITMKKHQISEVFGGYHHHDLYEILYIVSGKVLYSVEDKKYELQGGDMILISPTTLHQLNKIIDDTSQRIVLNFTENYINSFSTRNTNLLKVFELIEKQGIHKISLDKSYRKIIEDNLESMAKLTLSKEYGADLSYNLRFMQTMLIINHFYMNSIEEAQHFLPIVNPTISKIIDYVNNNIHNKITIKEIANHLALSASRLSHLFKEATGISILQYIIKKRLINAKELIRKGESLTNVSITCGFQDYTSFFRTFKKEYGITPKSYAKQFSR